MTYIPNVLLLDQDPILRRATALLLANRGVAVAPAATLTEAISLSQKRIYDVALIDLSPSMPRAGEVLLRLRREGMVPRRILLCTDEQISVEEAGDFSEILRKPYAFDQVLRSIFGQQSARRPTRSGVFPRLRVAALGDDLRDDVEEPSAWGIEDSGALVQPAAATLSGASDGRPLRPMPPDRVLGRVGRRGRGVQAGRALRSLRRAPRGVRYPE